MAVTTAVPVALAVNTPAGDTLPFVAFQVTAWGGELVPLTMALHAVVVPRLIVVGLQLTATLLTVGAACLTVTLAAPDLVESCVLVAVTTAVPVAFGVKTPALVTVPFVDVQFTACDSLLVPLTTAVQAVVAPNVTVAGVQETVTLVTVGTGVLVAGVPLTLPTQPTIRLDAPSKTRMAVARMESDGRLKVIQPQMKESGGTATPSVTRNVTWRDYGGARVLRQRVRN